jgi:hypothetical protein
MFDLKAMNVTAERLLIIMLVFGAADWMGSKLTGSTPSDSHFFLLAGLLTALAVVDHLHGIRRALEEREK